MNQCANEIVGKFDAVRQFVQVIESIDYFFFGVGSWYEIVQGIMLPSFPALLTSATSTDAFDLSMYG